LRYEWNDRTCKSDHIRDIQTSIQRCSRGAFALSLILLAFP
jgi:hypothetical protein